MSPAAPLRFVSSRWMHKRVTSSGELKIFWEVGFERKKRDAQLAV